MDTTAKQSGSRHQVHDVFGAKTSEVTLHGRLIETTFVLLPGMDSLLGVLISFPTIQGQSFSFAIWGFCETSGFVAYTKVTLLVHTHFGHHLCYH